MQPALISWPAFSPPYQSLAQVNEKIGVNTHYNMPTANFTTHWHGGKRICALVDSYVEGMFPGRTGKLGRDWGRLGGDWSRLADKEDLTSKRDGVESWVV